MNMQARPTETFAEGPSRPMSIRYYTHIHTWNGNLLKEKPAWAAGFRPEEDMDIVITMKACLSVGLSENDGDFH